MQKARKRSGITFHLVVRRRQPHGNWFEDVERKSNRKNDKCRQREIKVKLSRKRERERERERERGGGGLTDSAAFKETSKFEAWN